MDWIIKRISPCGKGTAFFQISLWLLHRAGRCRSRICWKATACMTTGLCQTAPLHIAITSLLGTALQTWSLVWWGQGQKLPHSHWELVLKKKLKSTVLQVPIKQKTQCDAYTSSLCLLNNKYASCKCHWIRMQLLLAVWMLNCRPYKAVRLFFLDIGLRILCCMHMRGHWYLTSFMSDMLLFPFKENLAKPMQCKEGWAVLETAIYTQNKQH